MCNSAVLSILASRAVFTLPEVTSLLSSFAAPTELAIFGVIVTAPLLLFTVKAAVFPLVTVFTTFVTFNVTTPLELEMAILSPAFKVTRFLV